MPEGNHEVRIPWGFLALRTNGLEPYPGEDKEWWADRVSILQALGVLDPEGNPTGRLDVVAQADVARFSAEAIRIVAGLYEDGALQKPRVTRTLSPTC
jgi:hypothetical protein